MSVRLLFLTLECKLIPPASGDSRVFVGLPGVTFEMRLSRNDAHMA